MHKTYSSHLQLPQLPNTTSTTSTNTVAAAELREAKIAITAQLLAADRKRAADVLLQLHYQFSQHTAKIEIK